MEGREEERKAIAGILLYFLPSFRHASIHLSILSCCCYVHHFRRESRIGLEIVTLDWMKDKSLIDSQSVDEELLHDSYQTTRNFLEACTSM